MARGIGLDNRIGPKFLHAGPGYGGSCFPKDTLALLKTADKAGVDQRIVRTTVAGQRRPQGGDGRARRSRRRRLQGKRIAVLGLAFKPNTDDMRDAPSIPLINALVERGAEVSAFDPVAREQAEKVFAGIEFAATPIGRGGGADALVIVTEWDEFRALDLEKIAQSMRGKVLVDLRNVYDRVDAEQAGLRLLRGRARAGSNPSERPARSRASSRNTGSTQTATNAIIAPGAIVQPVRSTSHCAAQGVRPPKIAVAMVAPRARPVIRASPWNCSAVATAPTALTPPATAARITAPSSAASARTARHQREHGHRQHCAAGAKREQHGTAADAVGPASLPAA